MRWFLLLLRWLLALLFILAGGSKLLDPASFKLQVEAYRLITGAGASIVATYLPWLELTAGVALLIPRWSRAAASILLGLMVVFSIALTTAWFRGINLRCGCFALELDWPFWGLILRDLVIVGCLCSILFSPTRSDQHGSFSYFGSPAGSHILRDCLQKRVKRRVKAGQVTLT